MSRPKRYTERVQATLPSETVARITQCAKELGISRSEYLRRFSNWMIRRAEFDDILAEQANTKVIRL